MLIGVSLVLFNRCCCIELGFLPFWRDAHATPAYVALFVIILRTPFDFPSCFEPLRWQIQFLRVRAGYTMYFTILGSGFYPRVSRGG